MNVESAALRALYGEMKKLPGSADSVATTKLQVEPEEGEPFCGVWVPGKSLTKVAIMQLLFQKIVCKIQLPVLDDRPPHVCVIFDAFKRKEVLEMAAYFPEDVMLHGFFTSAEPETAQLISKNVEGFEEKIAKETTYAEKLVLMVAMKRNDPFLSFATLGPVYMSHNSEEGEKDCSKFFPPTYVVPEEEPGTKKKRKKKALKAVDASEAKTEDEGRNISEEELSAQEKRRSEDSLAGDLDEAALVTAVTSSAIGSSEEESAEEEDANDEVLEKVEHGPSIKSVVLVDGKSSSESGELLKQEAEQQAPSPELLNGEK